ncbi:MAG: FtsQ-type POTRA domain-containing protein [Candidatus Doudnabacteria bacterium]|nr:FtsQ-type POTRA domain-containing protein [Candidatus Doudnabacteria bacterium]
MQIFSKHRKKLEPSRRFGGIDFRNKVKSASNYKRVFSQAGSLSLALTSGTKIAKISKAIGIAVILLTGYLGFSSTFSITNIKITGNHQIPESEIRQVLSEYGNSRLLFKKNHFFLMTQSRVNKVLTTGLPGIKEVIGYKRIWPNKAEVEVKEFVPGFVIESDGNLFLVDDEGVVIGETLDPGKLMIVRDQQVENFVRGETLPNRKIAPFILSMKKAWPAKINTGIETIWFAGKNSNDVHFTTTAGYIVLFDSTRPVSVQLSSLAVILSKQIGSSQIPNLAYVDLRLSKWAYYCFKESPCQQKEQPETSGAINEQ